MPIYIYLHEPNSNYLPFQPLICKAINKKVFIHCFLVLKVAVKRDAKNYNSLVHYILFKKLVNYIKIYSILSVLKLRDLFLFLLHLFISIT